MTVIGSYTAGQGGQDSVCVCVYVCACVYLCVLSLCVLCNKFVIGLVGKCILSGSATTGNLLPWPRFKFGTTPN